MINQNENTQKRYPVGRYDSQGNPIRRPKKIKIVRKKYRTRRVKRSEFIGKAMTLIAIAATLVVIGYSLREREIEIINEDVALASVEAATTVIPERLEENITPPVEQVIREVTAYNAGDPYQTDDTPCIGAMGTNICSEIARGQKICAANFVPLGTVLHVQNYGDCIVKDRMNERFYNRVDIAMEAHEKQRAVAFGLQTLLVKIVR